MPAPKFPVFAIEDGALIYAPKKMQLLRGSVELLERAAYYAELGHNSVPDDEQDGEQLEFILEHIHGDTPKYQCEDHPRAITRLNIGNTYRCNMGCQYCYNELSVKDRRGSETKGGMSLETSQQMIDALIEQSADERNLTLVFIGGEPLLEKHTLFATVAYARAQTAKAGKNVSVAVYTNGTLMNREVIDWANTEDVSLVVSLDGPPELHDLNRTFLNGKPTSGIVLKNIELLMKHSTSNLKRVRAVCDDVARLLPLHKYLLDLGFNEIHTQAPYYEAGINDTEDLAAIAEFIDWYQELLLKGTVISVNPFDHILQRIAMQGAAVTSWYPCTAGRSSVGVHQNGDIYPCHHFFEEKEQKIGNVSVGLPSMEDRKPYFKRVDKRTPCGSCWAQHLCGGECYHRAHTSGAGYDGVLPDSCRKRKAMLGLVLELFTNLAQSNPQVIKDLIEGNYSEVRPNWNAYQEITLTPG